MEALVRCVAAIERSDTLAALARAVRAFALPLGYDRFVLYSATPTRAELIEDLYWVEGDWLGDGTVMDVKTYLRACPVNHHILETEQPFFWTKRGERGAESYRVVHTPRGPGIHGFQVPVFGPHGLMGAMSFGGRHIDDGLATRLALSLVGQAALRRAGTLALPGAEARAAAQLTERERTVMRWMAAGKRQAEAASLMGISERTVENHLRRVRRRLGASTTAEAVRMAIRAGDIAA